MTNEQLTDRIVELVAYKEKAEEEHKTFKTSIDKLQESMDTFTKLAEDVHIMAISIENMQKTLEATNKKVDSIMSEEFLEYKENKKRVKQQVVDKITGGVLGFIGAVIVYFATIYFKG